MDLPYKAVREGKAAPQARDSMLRDSMLKGRDIIGDLRYVIQRHAWRLLHFEKQEIGERGLGALYLRR